MDHCTWEMTSKKCNRCGKVKSLKDYYVDKRQNSLHGKCKDCENECTTKRRNTERGFLKHRYDNMRRDEKTHKGRYNRRLFTFNEFLNAFEKHKIIYGMRSAWGPGPKHLDQHLPITMINQGKRTKDKKTSRERSNLSADRLDSNRDYTLQNIIFIRNDENVRKKDTSYNDCKIQIRLYEERFTKMEAI